MTRWPIPEVVANFRARARDTLLEGQRHGELVWALSTMMARRRSRPPAPPRILTEDDDDG